MEIVAYIWARTVNSPNPKFSHIQVPLVSSFQVCKKKNKEKWINYKINHSSYETFISDKSESELKSTVSRKGGVCLFSGTPIPFKYIREEGRKGNIGKKLLCIVCKGQRGRIYITPDENLENILSEEYGCDDSFLAHQLPKNPRDFKTPNYGLEFFNSLFSSRQKVGLITISDEIISLKDSINNNLEGKFEKEIDQETKALISKCIVTYLSMALGKATDYNSSVCGWISGGETVRNTFGRQAIPMVWDYCESNLLGTSTGSYHSALSQVVKVIERLPFQGFGKAFQGKAQSADSYLKIISTDPPYYDNIGYADLSDYFYLWMRRTLSSYYPEDFNTVLVPKIEELVATPYRHGGAENAELFFLNGMSEVFKNIIEKCHPAYPITIYYAFKQSETKSNEGTSSTGWETFLEAVLASGLCITGTWPMRTELGNRIIGSGTNVLASSIVLVCRKRDDSSSTISRRDFLRELNRTMPEAIEELANGQKDSVVAPVDLSQAVIGPGMAIFSKYSAVLEADGSKMTVKTALQLINRYVSENDFDSSTQFCIGWYESFGWDKSRFGEADVLARAKGTSVDFLKEGGVAESSGGSFRLYRWQEYPESWTYEKDSNLSHWEMVHLLIYRLNKFGESKAGELLANLHAHSDIIRALSYRLFTISERLKRSEDASNYNNLVLAWEAIEKSANEHGLTGEQKTLFDD